MSQNELIFDNHIKSVTLQNEYLSSEIYSTNYCIFILYFPKLIDFQKVSFNHSVFKARETWSYPDEESPENTLDL